MELANGVRGLARGLSSSNGWVHLGALQRRYWNHRSLEQQQYGVRPVWRGANFFNSLNVWPTGNRAVWSAASTKDSKINCIADGRRAHHSLVGRKAPDFEATAVLPDGSFSKVSLDQFKGKYVLLFFYPLDFTFVCPSEIVAFDEALEKFKEKGVEVLGCSIDSHFTHLAWRQTPRSSGGIGCIKYPLIADLTKKVAEDYGVLLPQGMALRGLFILNRDHKVCHAVVNDLPIGRSVNEALRVVDAIQFNEAHGEVCPADWKKGEKGMKPTAAGVAAYLSQKN